MCAGGTGPRHQPGCSFMKEQLERDLRDERSEGGRGGGGMRAREDDSYRVFSSTSERL